MKAVLLSACVFPGAGHFFLKKTGTGIALAATALISLYVVISSVVEMALQIADKIQRGEVQGDIVAIAELVTQQSVAADSQPVESATAILIVAWLIGIVDSYRVGRQSQVDDKA